ncbi:hypothetical protein LTR78_005310 [Recurvomyces mirabilis]|uniref:Uncharacterized protein n=1 Tax=Recurvomyces mirabilis TaxID=574656 RepID=A0AAE1C1Q1_9PEZI|nr:hypothetical protein LTR78_005310 [Recurvomyces mirabilis]KAK5157860.1 hypothetical protein LTS14_003782 [Recurvomyces mirabilis]
MDSTIALRMQKFRDEDEFIVSSRRKANTRLMPISLERILALQPTLIGITRGFQAKESPVKFWFRLPSSSLQKPAYGVLAYYPEDCWTGSVMHPRPLGSRSLPVDDRYSSGRADSPDNVVVAGVAVKLSNPTSRVSMVEDKVLFAFGYQMMQPERNQGDDEASVNVMTLAPAMSITIEDTPYLGLSCAETLRCVDYPRPCKAHPADDCPHSRAPRQVKLFAENGEFWLITMEMRERSIMGETTFVIDASISQHFELDGLMVPAELEAIEWTGRPRLYNTYEKGGYALTSRIEAWNTALELQKDTEAMYGSFAILVSNLIAVNLYSWDDVMGDKERVELEATEWDGETTTEATPRTSPTPSTSPFTRISNFQYALDAWQVLQALNEDFRSMLGDILSIPITYLTSMVPLTFEDRVLEFDVYKSLAEVAQP